ncbi:unnamed protein product, partial [Brenthis ino]
MNESEGEQECGVSTPKKKRVERGDLKVKKKHRQQKYGVEWESDPKFSKWLTRDPQDNFKSRCKALDPTLIPMEKNKNIQYGYRSYDVSCQL